MIFYTAVEPGTLHTRIVGTQADARAINREFTQIDIPIGKPELMAWANGMQRQIEGPDITGRRVLIVEDTSTTGGSALTAVHAAVEAGAAVVGVATVVDRATGAAEAIEAEGLPYRSLLGLADLGLT